VERTIIIGDTVYDVEMAINAGARAIGVSWGYHAPDTLLAAGAVAVAETMDELASLMERCLD
jgi:phosphoglycolate phosphatase